MRQRRSLVFFLLALLTLVMGFSSGRDLWFTIAYLLGLLLIVSFFWSLINLRSTKISRVTRNRRTQVGQPMEERILVVNTSIVPKLWLEVRDNSTFPDHNMSRVVTNLPPRKRYGWRNRTMSRLRGRYRLGPMLIRTSDPFGLFPMERKIDATTNVVVFPQTVEVWAFALPSGVLSGGDALRRRAFQVTTNAAGVRDYAPGDSFSRIHWRSTARRNRMIVKEFELDPQTDIWIVPDMSAAAQVGVTRAEAIVEEQSVIMPANEQSSSSALVTLPLSTEEYIVTIAASLARHFLRLDRAVGMMANGQTGEFVQPDRGERQTNKLLETLAVLRAKGTMDIANTMLTQSNRFQRGTTIIVITSTTDVAWAASARELMRRGLRVMTILVNPAGFLDEEDEAVLSADGLHSLLQLNAVPTIYVNAGDNLTEALSGTRRAAFHKR